MPDLTVVPVPPGPSPTPSPAPVRVMLDDQYSRAGEWQTRVGNYFNEAMGDLETPVTRGEILDLLIGLRELFVYTPPAE